MQDFYHSILAKDKTQDSFCSLVFILSKSATILDILHSHCAQAFAASMHSCMTSKITKHLTSNVSNCNAAFTCGLNFEHLLAYLRVNAS